jgi:enoyl-CoA hydratase/carnithine racemase
MSVTTERRDSVLVINMDDGRANAVSFDLCKAITAAVREAEDDPDL